MQKRGKTGMGKSTLSSMGNWGHAGVDALVHFAHGLKAAQEGEGGAQEGGDLQLGAQVEEQGAHPGEEQGGLDVQGQAVGKTGMGKSTLSSMGKYLAEVSFLRSRSAV